MDLGLTVEEADAVGGRPMGVPKTGIFGLMDLVGIDLMPQVAASMIASLPADDPYVRDFREHGLIRQMIETRLYRPQGQGRLLSAQPRGRRPGQEFGGQEVEE